MGGEGQAEDEAEETVTEATKSLGFLRAENKSLRWLCRQILEHLALGGSDRKQRAELIRLLRVALGLARMPEKGPTLPHSQRSAPKGPVAGPMVESAGNVLDVP